jgi:hypothetical protein
MFPKGTKKGVTMSRNGWEEGTIVLPSADFTRLRQLLQQAHQQHQERVYELTQVCWRGLTRHEQDRPREYRAAVEIFLDEQMVDNRQAARRAADGTTPYVGGPWRDLTIREARTLLDSPMNTIKPSRVQKGDMEFPSNRTTEFLAGEALITFHREPRTVNWTVNSRFEPLKSSLSHPLMQVLKKQLDELRWTSETGGVIERAEGVVCAYGPVGADWDPDKCVPYTTSRGEKVTKSLLARMSLKKSRMAA